MNIFKATPWVFVAAFAAAGCSSEALGTNSSVPSGSDGGSAGAVLPTATGCRDDGDFAFSLAASGIRAPDGVSARVVAIEPAGGIEPATDGRLPVRRAVDQSVTVEGGRFDVRCTRALKNNSYYPYVAVLIDIDHDGTCNAGDLGGLLQFYAWNAELIDQGFKLGEADASGEGVWGVVGAKGQGLAPVGVLSFCDAFQR